MKVFRHVLFPLVVSLIWIALSVASAVPAMMSVMLFDAPGSDQNLVLWWFLGSVWAFPVLGAVSALGVWGAWAYTRRLPPEANNRGATILVSVAALPFLAVLSGAAAGLTLTAFCGGETRCDGS